jgi:hypothetical protein
MESLAVQYGPWKLSEVVCMKILLAFLLSLQSG